jgi:glyoxylase-like metal-dependent hydrolase (beta-lactamase superfamily II)
MAVIALAAVLAIGVACICYATKDDSSPPSGANEPLLIHAAVTIAPDVYLLGEGFPNAAYVVNTKDGLALVDTCAQSDAAPILRQMQSLGLDVKRLRLILLTHAHGDHVLGAEALRQATGAKVYAGRGDCAVLRTGGPREAFFSMFEMDGEAHPTHVDVALAGGEVIELGEARFHVVATPGHTPGSVCYMLEKDHRRMLFTGDVVASLTDSSIFGGVGIYSVFLSDRYRGNAADFLKSLQLLRAMPVPDLVLPGHPRADPTPQSARMPQERWELLLQRAIDKLKTVLARRARDGVAFLDGVPKELLPGLRYWGEFGGRAVYAVITPARQLFLFDAPGGAGLTEFVRAKVAETGLPPTKPTAVLLTSCAPEAVAGLADLVAATRCAVIAPSDGVDAIRKICPDGADVRPAESPSMAGWFPLDVMPIQGRNEPAAAYVLRWANQTVVVSGRTPTLLTNDTLSDLRRAVAEPSGDAAEYLRTLDELAKLSPDLWLPAVPINEQNVRTYDGDWSSVIGHMRSALR